MRRKALKLLDDISESAASIRRYTENLSEKDYLANKAVRRAVEREFEIIGEAINRLRREDPLCVERISHVGPIIAFRNLLAHGYDVVRHEEVWTIIRQDIPILLAEVNALLAEDVS
jgi:uncharacterized protein with HEPN domain